MTRKELYKKLLNGTYASNVIYFDYYKLDYRKIVKIADALKNNTNITCVNFHGCKMDDKSAAYLFDQIKENNTITTLNMHGNILEKSAFIALSNMLEINTTIKELNLGSVRINYGNISYIEYIEKILLNNTKITRLGLSRTRLSSLDFAILVSALEKNSTIEELMLFNNKHISVANVIRLLKNENLKIISLHSCRINSDGINDILKSLMNNTNIIHIVLSYNEVTSNNTKTLCELIKCNKSLNNLEFGYNKFIDDDGKVILEALYCNNILRKLDLQQTDYPNKKFLPDINKELRISDETMNEINELLKKNYELIVNNE